MFQIFEKTERKNEQLIIFTFTVIKEILKVFLKFIPNAGWLFVENCS